MSGAATTAFGKGKEKGRTKVRIPDFLRPFIEDAASTGQGALGSLRGQLGSADADDLVAGFDPMQQAAQRLAIARAGGAGGFIPTAQNTFLDAARGTGLNQILDPNALRALQGSAGGQGIGSFIDQRALDALRQGAKGMGVRGTGVLQEGAAGMGVPGMGNLQQLQGQRMPAQVQNVLSRFAGQSSLPGQSRATLGDLSRNDTLPRQSRDALERFARESGLPPEAMNTLTQLMGERDLQGTGTLSSLIGQQGVPEDALNALRSTVAGEHLYGGEGFQAAVDAAVRSAQPHILSTFGRAGRGTGGLAETAIAQSGIDAFANQYGQERQNQLAAAGMLGDFGLSERGQTADIASTLAGLDLAGVDQRSGIAQALAGLGLAGADQQIGAATNLGQLGLAAGNQRMDAAGLLGQLGLAAGNQQIGAAQGLGSLNIADRGLSADINQALASLGLARNAQRIGAAESLAGVDLSRNAQRLGAAQNLAGLSDAERSRALQSAGLLGQFGFQERANQLNAAGQLPGLAMADVNVLNQVGQERQDLAQSRLDAPIQAQLQLLAAALGVVPTESLLGTKTKGKTRDFFQSFSGSSSPVGG